MVLCSGQKAPQNNPSCLSCCPLSRIEPSVQSVTAKDGLVDEAICAETMSWSDTSEGLVEREIVGNEVVRLTSREAAGAFLMEMGALIIY